MIRVLNDYVEALKLQVKKANRKEKERKLRQHTNSRNDTNTFDGRKYKSSRSVSVSRDEASSISPSQSHKSVQTRKSAGIKKRPVSVRSKSVKPQKSVENMYINTSEHDESQGKPLYPNTSRDNF